MDSADDSDIDLGDLNFPDTDAMSADSDQIRVLLKDDQEHYETRHLSPKARNVAIKMEKAEFGPDLLPFTPYEIIDLTDTDIAIKKEIPDPNSVFTLFKNGEFIDITDTDDCLEGIHSKTQLPDLGDSIIEISDGEDNPEEIIVFDDGSTSVAIKQEDPDVELLGASRNVAGIHDSSSSSSEDEPTLAKFSPKLDMNKFLLNKPKPKPPPVSLEKIREMQRKYAEFKKLQMKTGAGAIFRLPGKSNNVENGFEWMENTVIPDNTRDFQDLKMRYKAKRKARQNTLEDDVAYKKAQNEENSRVKRLAQDIADSEEEAEESDDGLFVPQGSLAAYARRPFSMRMDENDDDSDNSTDGVVPPEKPSLNKKKADEIKSKPDLKAKRARAKAFKKELRSNMMAGIEMILLRDQKREVDRAAREAEAQQASKSKKRKSKGNEFMGAKRTKTGRMNNIGSLTTSNIYDDSNANLDRQALPVVTETRKKEFMTSLIANIPLEDKKQANQDRIDIVKASKILALRNVVPDGKGNWKYRGMKSSLYHYQVTGAACMKLRETGEQHPYGGILADEMGLGKTVQMIATMISNRQTDREMPRCTLIVCSPALMRQWELELESHAESDIFPRIMRHHAGAKVQGKGAEQDLEGADIVLTTYGEVVRSYPSCDLPKHLKTLTEKEEWWSKEWEEKRDLLHRAHFYRVVLDEAQVIKNHTSQTSIACRALMAKHRWAISGTPIQNRLDELFPYFKFLRVRHTGSMSIFRQNFCLKDSDVCNKRLHSFLEGLMIRRTHQDTLLGAPLMKLPKNTQVNIELKMNQVEKRIYEKIRLRCVRAINAASRNVDFDDNATFKMVIVYFQRLRQMVAHIFMVQEFLQTNCSMAYMESLQDDILSESDDDDIEGKMLLGLRRMIQEKDESKGRLGVGLEFSTPEDEAAVSKAVKKRKTSELILTFRKMLKGLKKYSKWTEFREQTMCQKCGEQPDDPYVTSCLHLYCKDCLSDLGYRSSERDLDSTPCVKCGVIFTESQSCEGLKELEIKDLSASIFQQEEKTPAEQNFRLTMDYVDGKDGLILSTKTAAVKAQIERWLKEDPDRKIIVFTEWLMVMHIIGKICQKQGWKCTHYNGKMSYKARDQSLDAFRHPDLGIKILIASLKCGGTGLNLTIASKVICVDLWFNRCVEQQAFARVHRIGQKEETYITRYVMKDTVDERLVAMQEEKHEVISAAMDDRTILAHLTLPELLKLFGPVAYDENSKPFILVDDENGLLPRETT